MNKKIIAMVVVCLMACLSAFAADVPTLGLRFGSPAIPQGSFPSHVDAYGMGGWRPVDTTNDMHDIPEWLLRDGMAVWVVAETNLYVLQGTNWTVFSQGASDNLGNHTATMALNMGTYGITGSKFGSYAGYMSSGLDSGAYGYSAGTSASGQKWGAYGYHAGDNALFTNSHVFGSYAGQAARGNNRMYLDVYGNNPGYPIDGSTNDTIFMDSNGHLNLGGGVARAGNANAGGTLRGNWSVAGVLSGDGSGLSNLSSSGSTVMLENNVYTLSGAGTEGANGTYTYAGLYVTSDIWTNANAYGIKNLDGQPTVFDVFLPETWSGPPLYSSSTGIAGTWSTVDGTNPPPTGTHVDSTFTGVSAIGSGTFVDGALVTVSIDAVQQAWSSSGYAGEPSSLAAFDGDGAPAALPFIEFVGLLDPYQTNVTRRFVANNYSWEPDETGVINTRYELLSQSSIAPNLFLMADTNTLYVDGDETGAFNGTYVWDGTNYDNTLYEGVYVYPSNGVWTMWHNGNDMYHTTNSDPTGEWFLGFGTYPIPYARYGGNPESTASNVAAHSLSALTSNSYAPDLIAMYTYVTNFIPGTPSGSTNDLVITEGSGSDPTSWGTYSYEGGRTNGQGWTWTPASAQIDGPAGAYYYAYHYYDNWPIPTYEVPGTWVGGNGAPGTVTTAQGGGAGTPDTNEVIATAMVLSEVAALARTALQEVPAVAEPSRFRNAFGINTTNAAELALLNSLEDENRDWAVITNVNFDLGGALYAPPWNSNVIFYACNWTSTNTYDTVYMGYGTSSNTYKAIFINCGVRNDLGGDMVAAFSYWTIEMYNCTLSQQGGTLNGNGVSGFHCTGNTYLYNCTITMTNTPNRSVTNDSVFSVGSTWLDSCTMNQATNMIAFRDAPVYTRNCTGFTGVPTGTFDLPLLITARSGQSEVPSLPAISTITYDDTNIVTDASVARAFRVTLTNNAYLHLPTSLVDGQIVKWWIKQGGVGTNSLTLSPAFTLPTGTTNLALSVASGSQDLLIGEYDAATTNFHLTGLMLFNR